MSETVRQAMKDLQPEYYTSVFKAAAPWGLAVSGREWMGASDGHLLVLAAVDAPIDARLTGRYVETTREWFTLSQDRDQVVFASDLCAFANVGAAHRRCETCDDKREYPCESCNGDGATDCECRCGHEHEADCKDCAGRGKLRCRDCADLGATHYARLCDKPIDRSKIRIALETLGVLADETPIRVSVRGDMFRLLPDGESPAWMAVIMAIRSDGPVSVDFDKVATWRQSVSVSA